MKDPGIKQGSESDYESYLEGKGYREREERERGRERRERERERRWLGKEREE